LEDLREIRDFIARDSPQAAVALVDRALTASDRLALFPESGRTVEDFPELTYREIIVGNYRVVYRIERDRVWILAVVHGRRLFGPALGDG
jgi:plasmid stabilization system protein ParE